MTEVPRQLYFGSVAIEYGFLSSDQVKRCLEIQQHAKGDHKPPLGRIAVEQKFFSKEQATLVLNIQQELLARWKAEHGSEASPAKKAAAPGGDWVQAAPRKTSDSAVDAKRETKHRLALMMQERTIRQRVGFYWAFVVVYLALRLVAAAVS